MKDVLSGVVRWFGVLVLFVTALVFSGVALRFTWNFFQFGWNLLG